VWDISGKRLFTLGASLVTDLNFSPDGRWIVVADRAGTASLSEASDGTVQQTLVGHHGAINAAVFSPDSGWVATASDDQSARLWEIKTGKSTVLSGHNGPVRSVAFNPPSTLVITASTDGSALIWNVGTGAATEELRGNEDALIKAEFSSDGKRALTAGSDGTVRYFSTEDACSGPLQGGFGLLWTTDSSVRNALGCSLAREEGGIAGTQYFPNGMLYWWDPGADIYVFYGQESGTWERYSLGTYTGQPVDYQCPSGIVPQRGFGQFMATHDDIATRLGKCPTTIEEGPAQADGLFGARQVFDKGLALFMPKTEASGEKRIWMMAYSSGTQAGGSYTRRKDLNP
jgi:WD40 repeat protein